MADCILSYFSHFLNCPHQSWRDFPFKPQAWEPSFNYGPRFSLARFSRNAVWKELPEPGGLGSRPKNAEILSGVKPVHAPAPHGIGLSRFSALVVGRFFPKRRKIKILLVEDSKIPQMVAKLHFANLNCEVDIAESGEQGVEHCVKHQYDLLLMDIDLPGMNGITTTKLIRRTPSANQNTLIIGLSTHDEPHVKNQAFVAGMDAYFVKPLTFEKAQEILAMVKITCS